MSSRPSTPIRRLVLVLGDQLNVSSLAFKGFDPDRDAVWMAEVDHEATKVWSHKARIALFLSAMRHFRDTMRSKGWSVDYHELTPSGPATSFSLQLLNAVTRLRPAQLVVVEPGEWGVQKELEAAAARVGVPLDIREDRHFLCTKVEFAAHAARRKTLRLEFFYREMRRRYGVLMDGKAPVGGAWNWDKHNRKSFSKAGPGTLPRPPSFAPDATTRDVIQLVNQRYADHPGSLDSFHWPVTRGQALKSLEAFIAERLPRFGDYQDALWTEEPFLYHSLLSSSLNLKLLHPLEVVVAAETAYRDGDRDLHINAVEGFIRQILGWREFVRGVYWLHMPGYLERNALHATRDLPGFYWTGNTEMRCLGDALEQTLEHGYAHHIQRLMITGLFALLAGVDPRRVHEWYLAVYVDAVEWVEAPNTLGMSQFADGGVLGSKPYAATGKYVQRMGNYCDRCRYDPSKREGEDACPFTVLYWDFLDRNAEMLRRNQRMRLQLKNLDRLAPAERKRLRKEAVRVLETVAS